MSIRNQRGSLPVTLLLAMALVLIVIGLMGLGITNTRLTSRNEFRAQARAVAESELEHLYYLFKSNLATGMDATVAATKLAAAGAVDDAITPSTTRQAYLTIHRDAGWTVRRAMHYVDEFRGVLPTGELGRSVYVDAKVEVIAPAGSPWAGSTLRYARQFSMFSAVVFQNCIFYQGDLELAPGGDTTIDGNIIANGSVYLGASPGGSVTLKGKVSYLKGYGFNTDPGADGIFGVNPATGKNDDEGIFSTYRKPDTPTASNLTAPTFYYSQDQQLKEASSSTNLLGGLDAISTQEANPDLFPTVNDVYRSVIVPPPSAGNANEYADPASLTDSLAAGAQRAYNSNTATLLITVEANGTVSIVDRSSGTSVDATSDYSSAITLAAKDVYDMREGRKVTITEIDIGKLGDLVASKELAGSKFGGLVYVNLKKGTADSPSAVRLVNASTLPKSGTDGKGGFSLVTNGGLYVKGSYNTTKLDDGTVPMSMLMADAMTVLSKEWDDANAENTDVTARLAKTDLTINAALMVGTTAATSTEFSGGAQNLVRFLEDWASTKDADGNPLKDAGGANLGNRTVTFFGSFGRLFESKMFSRPWKQPGTIYIQPKSRNYSFDEHLRSNDGPPGSLRTWSTARGRFYQW